VDPDLEGALCRGPIESSLSCEKKPEGEGDSRRAPLQRCQASPAAGAVAARSRLEAEGNKLEGRLSSLLFAAEEGAAAKGEGEGAALPAAAAATVASIAAAASGETPAFGKC